MYRRYQRYRKPPCIEDTKDTISRRLSKKNRQYNVQKKQDKRTINDLQNITQKTKDQASQTTLKTITKLRFRTQDFTTHAQLHQFIGNTK